MGNLTIREKKRLEAMCGCHWPDAPHKCQKDYSRHCPHGWFEARDRNAPKCIRPQGYVGCAGVQRFDGWSVAQKTEWESLCGVSWPCRDRRTCRINWDAPCPADWFMHNGVVSCLAPSTYNGPCPRVLHGLRSKNRAEKEVLGERCGVVWPCSSESLSAMSWVQWPEWQPQEDR